MYPIALHLQGKKCIVFGAGKVAQRRVWGLLESGAEVTVAAPEPMPACWKNAKLTYLQQPYAPELLGENLLVFAATDDSAENARIVREAQAAGKLASSATVSPDCTPDFTVPAHRKHGDITMAVTTEGDAPSLEGRSVGNWNRSWQSTANFAPVWESCGGHGKKPCRTKFAACSCCEF